MNKRFQQQAIILRLVAQRNKNSKAFQNVITFCISLCDKPEDDSQLLKALLHIKFII